MDLKDNFFCSFSSCYSITMLVQGHTQVPLVVGCFGLAAGRRF